MNLDWLASPLGCYSLLTIGLSLSLYLFLTLKREIGSLRTRARQYDNLAATIREMESRAVPQLPRGGMDRAKRSEVLRIHRRGQNASSIATALEIPRNEVELLLKVHQLTAKSCQPSAVS